MPRLKLEETCNSLKSLQRDRIVTVKSRIMLNNRTLAVVASTLGYKTGMDKEARDKLLEKAQVIIDEVMSGKLDHPLKRVIQKTCETTDEYVKYQKLLESQMLVLAKELPVAKWVTQKEQKGFGPLSLSILIGEMGNLDNFASYTKVWKFMACAPHAYEGECLMGSTWRMKSKNKLPASEWEKYGYNPRRRSISYLIGENLMKQNGTGPYRERYDKAKLESSQLHTDWQPIRCHRHGMLLACKLLYKNLRREWGGKEIKD